MSSSVIKTPAEMTTPWTEPLAVSSARSAQLAVFHSSSNHFFRINLELYCDWSEWSQPTSFQTWRWESCQLKSVAALHRKRPPLLSWWIQIWCCPGLHHILKYFLWTWQKWKQVVINSIDWAVSRLEDLRMPFLILHGLQDQLSLPSGSRWP